MTESMNLRAFVAARVKELRRQQGLSQETLSNKAALEPKYVNKLEVGKTNITVDTLEAIITALGIDYPTFFKAFQFPETSGDVTELLGTLAGLDEDVQKRVIEAIMVLLEGYQKSADQ